MPMFQTKPAKDESFLETAPWIFHSTTELNCSPQELFDILINHPQEIWHPSISNEVWVSSNKDDDGEGNENHDVHAGGIGAKRTVKFSSCLGYILLGGPVKLEETFDQWDDGRSQLLRPQEKNNNNDVKDAASTEDNHDDDNDDNNTTTKTIGFHFTAQSRPTCMMWKAGKEKLFISPIFQVAQEGDDRIDKKSIRKPIQNKCILKRTVAFEPSFLPRYVFGWIIKRDMKQLFEVKCPKSLKEAVDNTKFNSDRT